MKSKKDSTQLKDTAKTTLTVGGGNNNTQTIYDSSLTSLNSFRLLCCNSLKSFNITPADINILIDKIKVSITAADFNNNRYKITTDNRLQLFGKLNRNFVIEKINGKIRVRRILRYSDPDTGKPNLSIHAPYRSYDPRYVMLELHQPTPQKQALLAELFTSLNIRFFFTYLEVAIDFLAADAVAALKLFSELMATTWLRYTGSECGVVYEDETAYTNRKRKSVRNKVVYLKARDVVRLELRLRSSLLKRHCVKVPVVLEQFNFNRYIRFKQFDFSAFERCEFRRALKQLRYNKSLLRHKQPHLRLTRKTKLYLRIVYNASRVDGFMLDHLLMNLRHAGFKSPTRWLRDL